jgi:hypothetical protein
LTVPINEIIGLLSRVDQKALDALAVKYPGSSELLKPGLIAGARRSGNIEPPVMADLEIRAEVSLLGVTKAKEIASWLAPLCRGRLKNAGRLILASQVVTLITGASILGSLQQEYMWITYFLAGMNLFASLGGIFVRYLKGSGREQDALEKDYEDLVLILAGAEEIQMELTLWQKQKWKGLPEKLVQRANVLSERLNRVLSRNPWAPLEMREIG